MSDIPKTRKHVRLTPANDNPNPNKGLAVEVRMPDNLPTQRVEVEVLALLLDSLGPAANDNEELE